MSPAERWRLLRARSWHNYGNTLRSRPLFEDLPDFLTRGSSIQHAGIATPSRRMLRTYSPGSDALLAFLLDNIPEPRKPTVGPFTPSTYMRPDACQDAGQVRFSEYLRSSHDTCRNDRLSRTKCGGDPGLEEAQVSTNQIPRCHQGHTCGRLQWLSICGQRTSRLVFRRCAPRAPFS